MSPRFFEHDTLRRESGKKRRPRHFLVSLIVFLCLSITVALFYTVLSADVFKVKRIAVSGVRGVPEEQFLGSVAASLIRRGTIASWLGPENILFWKYAPRHVPLASILPIVADVSQSVSLRTGT